MKAKKITEKRKEDLIKAIKENKIAFLCIEGSKNSMTDYIKVIEYNGKRIDDISAEIGQYLGYRYNKKNNAISVSGCGFDKRHQVWSYLLQKLGLDYINDDIRINTIW